LTKSAEKAHGGGERKEVVQKNLPYSAKKGCKVERKEGVVSMTGSG